MLTGKEKSHKTREKWLKVPFRRESTFESRDSSFFHSNERTWHQICNVVRRVLNKNHHKALKIELPKTSAWCKNTHCSSRCMYESKISWTEWRMFSNDKISINTIPAPPLDRRPSTLSQSVCPWNNELVYDRRAWSRNMAYSIGSRIAIVLLATGGVRIGERGSKPTSTLCTLCVRTCCSNRINVHIYVLYYMRMVCFCWTVSWGFCGKFHTPMAVHCRSYLCRASKCQSVNAVG